MNLANLLKALLGLAEGIVPIFVHNAQSQKIEAVIFTAADSLVDTLAQTPAIVTTGQTHTAAK